MLSACLPKWWTNYLQPWQFGQTSFKMDPEGNRHFPGMIIPGRQDSCILLLDGLLVEFHLHNENISYYRSKMKKELPLHMKNRHVKKKKETLSIRLNHKLWLKPPDFFPLVWLHLNFSPTPSLYHRMSDAVCFEPKAKQVREEYLSPKFKQIGAFYSKDNRGVSFTTWTQN